MEMNNNMSEMNSELNLYDLNKQLVPQLPTLNEEQVISAKAVILDYVCKTQESYYMLLCHELRYFTVFAMNAHSEENVEDALLDCLSYVGEVKSIESNGEAVEIWVVLPTGEAHVMYFFNYESGVIQCQ